MKELFKIIISISILFGIQLKAQSKISLESAYEKAYKNNLILKNGKLLVDYQDKIKKSYAVVEPLNISGEIGQINSAYIDNRIAVGQTFHLPGFYKTHKQVLIEEWKNSMLSLDLEKWQLKQEIALIYNELNYQDEKEKLLQQADSIYNFYYKQADLLLKKEKGNILESITAESHRSNAEIELANLQKDREVSLFQFNYLLNDEVSYINENADFYQLYLLNQDQTYAGNPAVLKQLQQQKNIELAKLSAEKSKLLPTLNIEYGNTSMMGTGADDIYHLKSERFHSGMIGIGIPLFNGAQKSLIEGQKINQLIAENNYEYGAKMLKHQYKSLFGEYEKLKFEADYYKTKGLKNANTIMKTGTQLYAAGEINFQDYSDLISQSLQIKNKLIDVQKLLNEKIIEINNLTHQ